MFQMTFLPWINSKYNTNIITMQIPVNADFVYFIWLEECKLV